jgi:predicted transcriptional regulator
LNPWKFFLPNCRPNSPPRRPAGPLDRSDLVAEAVEGMVESYDEWFLAGVKKGLAQAEQGKTLSHEEVGARLDSFPASKQHAEWSFTELKQGRTTLSALQIIFLNTLRCMPFASCARFTTHPPNC